MTAAERFYRWLLDRILPAEFRREAEAELLEVFRQQRSEAASRGWLALSVFWLLALWDLALTRRAEKLAGRKKEKRNSMAHLIQDLRYAWRALANSPAFLLAGTLTLALGIGANATVFSLVNALFFEPPPHVEDPRRLVRLTRIHEGRIRGSFSYPDFRHYRDNNSVFQELAAYEPQGPDLTVARRGVAWPARGYLVSDNYFDALGTRPAAGRWFRREENRTPATHPVAVLSHSLASRIFGSPGQAVGESLTFNGNPFLVAGVAPEGFRGASPIESPPDAWFPIMMQPVLKPADGDWPLERVPGHRWNWLTVLGRLKPGVTVEAAQANVDSMSAYLEKNFAEWNEDTGAQVDAHYRYHPRTRGQILSVTQMLAAATAMLLLIACVNIAILLLARGSSRARDSGIRSALGAGRFRLLRLALLESLLVALPGGAAGTLAAYWASGLAASLLPFEVSARPEWRVIAAAGAVTIATALLAGLWPALQSARLDAMAILRGDERSAGGGRMRAGLVVAQVALSLLLLCGAGLLARSLGTAWAVDLGFQLEDRVLLRANLRNHGYDEERGREFIRRALARLRSQPFVRQAATLYMVPFRGMWTSGVLPEGAEYPEGAIEPGTNAVSHGYFETMGIPIVRGRSFTRQDGPESPRVVIVNEAFAQAVWPGEPALGQTLRYAKDAPPATVVGVARTSKYYQIDEGPTQQVYWPVLQRYQPRVAFLAHVASVTPQAVDRLRQGILEIDPSLALSQPETLAAVFANEVSRYRVLAISLSLFAVLALLLSAVGLYGVHSFLVARRRREIGIRMALGASRERIRLAVLSRVLRQTAAGIALGGGAAAFLAGWIGNFLFAVPVYDPVAWSAVTALLLLTAAAAGWLPALRASNVDPISTLRAE